MFFYSNYWFIDYETNIHVYANKNYFFIPEIKEKLFVCFKWFLRYKLIKKVFFFGTLSIIH